MLFVYQWSFVHLCPGFVIIHPHFHQISSPLKPLDRLKSDLIWNICALWEPKVSIIGPAHMTKMATMPIYGENPLKIFSRTISQMTLKLGTHQKGVKPYKSYINVDPGLTLTYFTRLTLFISAFTLEKSVHTFEHLLLRNHWTD